MDDKIRGKHYVCIKSFVIAEVCAIFAILPYILMGNGNFSLSNDFSAGAIPQTMLMNHVVKSGSLWSWGIDLGGTWIEDLSWVGMFSPFSILSYVFPARLIPKLMGWLLILKFGVAALTTSIYLQRYFKLEWQIIVGALLYAFSGYQSCSIDFFFFQDVVAFFPLLLWAIDSLVEDKRTGVMTIACVINIFCNFVFFFGEILFCIIYFVVKYCVYGNDDIKNKLGAMIKCCIEGIIAGLLSSVVIVPFVNNLMNNHRASERIFVRDWFSISTADILTLVHAYLLPSQVMNNGATVRATDWMTRSAYIPLFGAVLCMAYVFRKKNWKSCLLIICMVMSVIPILNSSFFAFSRTPYNRWYYMIVLIEVIPTLEVLEDMKKYPIKSAVGIAVGMVLTYIVMVGVFQWDEEIGCTIYNINEFIFQIVIFVIGIITILCVDKFGNNVKMMCGEVACICIVCLSTNVYWYQQPIDNSGIDFNSYKDNYSEAVVNYLTDVASELDKDVLPYRYQFDEGIGYTYYNLGMTYDLPSINSFLSTISNSIFEYYDCIGVTRNTMTPYGGIGSNELLGAKYVVSMNFNDRYRLLDTFINSNGQVFYLMENEYAIPMGSVYDTYITKSEFQEIDVMIRPLVMVKDLIIDDESVDKISKTLMHDDDYMTITSDNLAMICSDKGVGSKYSFDKSEIKCKYELEEDKYLFFTIPYDDGWKVFVNGKEVEKMNVNGFISFQAPAGKDYVCLKYSYSGIYIIRMFSVIGIISFILLIKFRKKDSQSSRGE